MGCGGDPPAPSRPTPKVTEGGTGTGRAASRLLSTRSFPSLFTDSAMSAASVAELSRNAPCSSGGRNGSARSGGIGAARPPRDWRACWWPRRRPTGGPARTAAGCSSGCGSGCSCHRRRPRSPLSSSAARLARRSEVEELAREDYTCVIARGPNPKMTHIFEDRVVESRADAGAGGGGADACCFLSSSCFVCNKDAALLLKSDNGNAFEVGYKIRSWSYSIVNLLSLTATALAATALFMVYCHSLQQHLIFIWPESNMIPANSLSFSLGALPCKVFAAGSL
ncbi:unnamed protein product [Miscanthus lutarioriparius]|uniref:Uncharacterized protein n=1 Tax=Miscanthus lutarioriparius TaxID=422564 RepID=A0A811NQW5_9POAL|nr:unnamed protein product [Miscanthus lutarioriparius]